MRLIKDFVLNDCELSDSIVRLLELDHIPYYPEADFQFTDTKLYKTTTTPKQTYTLK